ncbi:C6 zinc finger domain-containing protein [Colletotrichum simmondsii]|uniref:C6 zinc finger domain-containing protein n=1 Tax=Colletotrichum simmondsii TaxID=703756 RepID=A0A135SZ24_9PEZI|nr:C6 zinc finger domain-containing protein [Colletotrichum simmondsii]
MYDFMPLFRPYPDGLSTLMMAPKHSHNQESIDTTSPSVSRYRQCVSLEACCSVSRPLRTTLDTVRFPKSNRKLRMVFLGRPSEACYPCRKGRLRIVCPGYRDPSEFYFRDETANAAFKVQNRKPRRRLPAKTKQQSQSVAEADAQKQHAGSSGTPTIAATPRQAVGTLVNHWSPSSSSSSTPPSDGEVVRYRTISSPIEDLARTYFMTDYIATSPFDYLPKLCPYGLTGNDAMSASILAASFASLSLKISDPKLMKQARVQYASALCQTNQALSSPKLAVEDSTLAAVLLLGLFEAIVFSGQQSMDSWNQHTLGSVELLRLRGSQQFETALGRKLFVHSANNIRTSCAHSKTPVPTRFIALYDDAQPYLDHSDPFLRVTPVLDRVAMLRSRIAYLEDSERHEVLVEALDLDAATAKLGQEVSAEWRFTARDPYEKAPMTYKGISFRYPSLRALRYWNSLRIIRMFLNDLIWMQASLILAQGPTSASVDYFAMQEAATRKMSTLVVEVLASCGEYLETTEDRFSVTARCLIWPLSVIAEISITPPDARRFALDCLGRLSRDGRIPRPIEVANTMMGLQADW